ncbi:MAG: O-antigen ligase family protein [bacterium]|nr:O-antigen ligase family protein [bacterium]
MKSFFDKHFIKIIIIFVILSPIIDLLTSLTIRYNIFSIGTITRGIFLIFCLIYYFFFYNNNKKILLFLILIFIYIILFSINNYSYTNISNCIKAFYYPILLLILLDINKKNHINFKTDYFIIIIVTYLMLIYIPNITNTGFNSYLDTKLGSTGWFYSSNEISGIISLLVVLLIYKTFNNNYNQYFKIFMYISLLILLYVSLTIGTKSIILSIGISAIFLIIIYLTSLIKRKKIIIFTSILSSILIGSIIFITYIIPNTTFYKNINIHLDYLEQDSISSIFKDGALIDHFIFSSRIKFLNDTKDIYEIDTFYNKLIGIGYEKSTKMIEMDYYDILFRHGIIGFILYNILVLSFKNIKKLKTETKCLLLSLLLSIILSLFTGHIIINPAVSTILIFIIISLINQLKELPCKQ